MPLSASDPGTGPWMSSSTSCADARPSRLVTEQKRAAASRAVRVIAISPGSKNLLAREGAPRWQILGRNASCGARVDGSGSLRPRDDSRVASAAPPYHPALSFGPSRVEEEVA